MKNWPEDKFTYVYYEELMAPLRKSLNAAYDIKRTPLKNIPYDGFNAGPDWLCGNPPPDQQLQADMIKYHKERDRDVMDILLNIAFALGMEQGRRMERQDNKSELLLADIYRNQLLREAKTNAVPKRKKAAKRR